MNILFDLLHPADVNLFKNSIYKLKNEGQSVFLTFRQRGVLEIIARSEFPDFILNRLGIHRNNLAGKVYSIIQREVLAFRFLRKNKINLVVCQGLACGIACKLLGVKILHYDDDCEYRLTFLLGKWFSDIDVMPDFIPFSGKNFFKYKGFKELAYLHPDYFTPYNGVLSEYGLQPYNYVFIREISNVSVNYSNHSGLLPEILNHLIKNRIKILLSIEDKSLMKDYSENCIILKEPVDHLYSLIYYSKYVISSGDTVARESCLLGSPCIYTGGRVMLANRIFIDMGLMIKAEREEEVFNSMDKMIENRFFHNGRERMTDIIRNEYEDTNAVLTGQIKKLLTKQGGL